MTLSRSLVTTLRTTGVDRFEAPAAEAVNCGRRLRRAAEQPPPLVGRENEPSVRSTATAPSRRSAWPARLEHLHVRRSSSIRSIMMSLISRAVSHETTSPARIWPSSIRLATSTMPLSTPRQALLMS